LGEPGRRGGRCGGSRKGKARGDGCQLWPITAMRSGKKIDLE
jgi:hypothetical protein